MKELEQGLVASKSRRCRAVEPDQARGFVKIALGVTGCIAAYKAIEVMRGLQKAGSDGSGHSDPSAAWFVTPLTFESLSGQKVITDMFRPELNLDIRHISLAQECTCWRSFRRPQTFSGKFAHGIADDFLSTLYLSTARPRCCWRLQ